MPQAMGCFAFGQKAAHLPKPRTSRCHSQKAPNWGRMAASVRQHAGVAITDKSHRPRRAADGLLGGEFEKESEDRGEANAASC